MPYKDPNDPRKKQSLKRSAKKYYELNKAKVQKLVNKNKRESRARWRAFKSTFSCANCGFSHPAAIDFHHVDRKNKRGVHELAQEGKYKAAKEEAEKCIPLCANCHRIHHHEERLHKKKILKGKKKKSKSNP
jgi:hypothetical protein